MSYRLYQKNQSPVAAWVVDNASPFNEHSGSGAAGTQLGTAQGTHAPLVSCAAYATVFANAGTGRFTNSLFIQGREERPFALEAWVYQFSPGQQQILSHSGVYDGLWINGTVVHFSTNYLTNGTADCSYDLRVTRAAHVVGVHTFSQNQLWVDGVMVDSVDITEDQRADSYIATDGFLYCGGGTGSIAVNGVAIYNTISPEGIKRNFTAGRMVIPQTNVPSQLGGIPLYLGGSASSVYFERNYITKTDFETGYGTNVNFEEDVVSPRLNPVTNLSIASSWSVGFPLDVVDVSNIYGVYVEWSGDNVTVEARIDSGSWTALTNRRLISTIGPSFTTTNKTLEIRVSFPAGLAQGVAFLESLSVIGLKDANFNSTELRTITVSYPGVPRKDYEPIEYRDDNGVFLNGGTLTIGADTAEVPTGIKSFEVWLKTTGAGVTSNFAGTRYKNGVASSVALTIGEWSVLHFTSATDIVFPLTISGNVIVGQFALYPTTLTAAEIDRIWKSYTGSPVVTFNDTGTITVTEDASPITFTLADWAVEVG